MNESSHLCDEVRPSWAYMQSLLDEQRAREEWQAQREQRQRERETDDLARQQDEYWGRPRGEWKRLHGDRVRCSRMTVYGPRCSGVVPRAIEERGLCQRHADMQDRDPGTEFSSLARMAESCELVVAGRRHRGCGPIEAYMDLLGAVFGWRRNRPWPVSPIDDATYATRHPDVLLPVAFRRVG